MFESRFGISALTICGTLLVGLLLVPSIPIEGARDLDDCGACVRDAITRTLDEIRTRGWLGLGLHYHRTQGGEVGGGAEVTHVTPGSPASTAGLEAGDVLLRWNDTTLADTVRDEIQRLSRGVRPGDRVRLLVNRKGRRMEVELRAGAMPPQAQAEALGAQMIAQYLVPPRSGPSEPPPGE